jgi:hypothetical protein
MRVFLYGFVAITALLGSADAGAEIFRCEDPEDGIVYQEVPCPEPKAEEADDVDSQAVPATPAQPRRLARGQSVEDSVAAIEEENRRREEVEACKQQYRDAIDAIDLEIENSYSPEQKEYYLGRLKALTEKMSAC